MAIEKEDLSTTTTRLRLHGACTVYEVAAMQTDLLAAVQDFQRVEMDLSQVDDLDTAGLQLLMVCKQESRRLGHEMSIVAHSNAVVGVFEFLNLAAFFGDPLVLPATGG